MVFLLKPNDCPKYLWEEKILYLFICITRYKIKYLFFFFFQVDLYLLSVENDYNSIIVFHFSFRILIGFNRLKHLEYTSVYYYISVSVDFNSVN